MNLLGSCKQVVAKCSLYLFESLIVDKARSILGDVELSLLNVFAELPIKYQVSQTLGSDTDRRRQELLTETYMSMETKAL